MTKDDIIKMAREAGLVIDGNNSGDDDLFAFANLVAAAKAEVALAEAYRCGCEAGAAAERESCAELCDGLDDGLVDGLAGWQFGEAIRARGEQT